MAFRELVEGDCGGPSSLIKLTSHFVRDHGFKEEGIHHPFHPVDPIENADSDQLVRQFMEEGPGTPQTFKMDNLLQEMREIDHNIHPPIPAPGVAQELTGGNSAWANEYLQSGMHFNEHHPDTIWNPPMAKEGGTSSHIPEVHEFGLGPKWAEDYIEQSIDTIENDIKGDDTPEGTEQSEDPNFAHSKFMKYMRQEEDILAEEEEVPLSNAEATTDEWVEEFHSDNEKDKSESVTKATDDDEVLNKVEEELAVAGSWVDEFAKASSEELDNYESAFWSRLQNGWDKISSSEELASKHPWLSEYDSYYDPYENYEFREANPMKDLTNAFEEGKRRLDAGDLPGAVLCFEAAVQQDEKNSEAWLFLGKSQAANEQDPLAISALKQCLSLDPTNGTALMALAVCYTNESYQHQACLTLKEWLLRNEKYKHLCVSKPSTHPPPKSTVSSILLNDVHNEVMNLYIQAARMNPRDEIDADVQCGLGVLFNLSNEYDKACDCFQAALQVRPNDSRLWNRLGATLANGHRSEEAVHAYHRALELSPGYIRARYNLGISCINLEAYREAVEHLLTALNQQAAGRGIEGERALPEASMSHTIWLMLKLAISLMHMYHLNEAIENRDLERLNKEFEIM